MIFKVEIEQEEDGRWIAEVVELPGVLAYGRTADEARARVQALALRVVADKLEHGEAAKPETPATEARRRGGMKGGRRRAKKLTPAKRKAIAKKAATARWTRRQM